MKANGLPIFHGNARPVNLYCGRHKITGWRWSEQSASDMPFERTYNDRVDMAALGRSRQAASVQGRNLFDRARAIENRGLLWNNGGTYSLEKAIASDFISVVEGTRLCSKYAAQWLGYDGNKGHLGILPTNSTDPFPGSQGNRISCGIPIGSGVKYARVAFRPVSTQISYDFTSITDLQVEIGSTATPYAPFVPNSPSPDYPSPIISSAGIIRSEDRDGNGVQRDMGILRAIPDGAGGWAARDELTVERVGGGWHLMRRQRVGHKVFDGTEAWALFQTSFFHLTLPSSESSVPSSRLMCTHYSYGYGSIQFNTATQLRVWGYSTSQSVADWKAQLAAWHAAGNPLVVAYPLATPVVTDLGPIDLPSYYPHTRVLVSGDYPPDVTARCRVVDEIM